MQNSSLGFGCMRFPTLPNGKIDREKTFLMLDEAYAGGITYYDTAFPYHAQESETVLGLWLETKPREALHIATKLPVWLLHNPQEAHAIFKEQLHRLRTDYVDYYLFHALSASRWKTLLQENILPLLNEWKIQGKIKFAGFSFHDGYSAFEEIINNYPWDFCQLQLNYCDTEQQAGLLGYYLAEKKHIPVIVMEPVKGGRLAKLPMKSMQYFKEIHPDWTPASWALRWAASLPNVPIVLSGMSSLEQVRDNLQTFASPELSRKEFEAIKFAAKEIQALTQVSCTACGYCQPCPIGIEIPDIFTLWNNAVMFNEESKSRANYKHEEKNIINCIHCGNCTKLCPQQIDVPKMLQNAHNFLNFNGR